jgi:preprotein translocase SecE subunit
VGRSQRRQQERATRRQERQQQRAAAGGGGRGPSMSVSAPAAGDARTGRRFVPRWVVDILSELRKVTWPSRHEVGYLTLVVILVSALVGAILGAADLGFSWLIERTMLR